jgi:integration host factor subunit beta
MDRADVRTITKKELAERIADKTGEKRAAVRKVLQEFLDEIVTELAQGNRIEFREFGVFEIKTRAARTAQNPRTLQRVLVPERRSVKFKPGSAMRDQIESVEAPGPPDEPGPPLPEPKTGIRPETDGFGKRIDGPIQIDGAAARDGQTAQRA